MQCWVVNHDVFFQDFFIKFHLFKIEMCNIIIVFIVTFAKFKAGVESVDPGGTAPAETLISWFRCVSLGLELKALGWVRVGPPGSMLPTLM